MKRSAGIRRLREMAGGHATLATVRRAVSISVAMFQATGSLIGKISVCLFLVKLVVAHLAPRIIRHEDTTLYFQGVAYSVGVRSTEMLTFGELYNERIYEREPDFIPRRDWTVFDLGANVGLFAIPQARRGAKVFAFEPNPDCYRRMSKTIARNGLADTVHLYNEALSCEPGAGMLVVPNGWSTMGSVTSASANAVGAVPITITSLDRVVPLLGVKQIDLLKVDVEGAEIDVLRGALQTLALVERIIMEYHSWHLLEQARTFLHHHGYEVVREIQDKRSAAGAGVLYAKRYVAA